MFRCLVSKPKQNGEEWDASTGPHDRAPCVCCSTKHARRCASLRVAHASSEVSLGFGKASFLGGAFAALIRCNMRFAVSIEPRASISRSTARMSGGVRSAMGRFPIEGKTSRSRLRMTSLACLFAHWPLAFSYHLRATPSNVCRRASMLASICSFLAIAGRAPRKAPRKPRRASRARRSTRRGDSCRTPCSSACRQKHSSNARVCPRLGSPAGTGGCCRSVYRIWPAVWRCGPLRR